jgi:hypothetical protein
MARVDRLTTAFVKNIPEQLEDGVLYVSHECHVALHKCACGCGEEVATPLVPTEYDFTMEDEGASIWPSIGNHDFPCGSHYIIKRGRIHWADKMSRAQIEAGRAHDRLLKRGASPKGLKVMIAWLKRLWTKFIG